MRKITEREAKALLAGPLYCLDAGPWGTERITPDTLNLSAGLVNDLRLSSGLYVKLQYRHSHQRKIKKYIFTVFKWNQIDRVRLYQLQVIQTPKPIRDVHRRSHEHLGDCRTIGELPWESWSYPEVLAYFCERTNICFVPVPEHPEHVKCTEEP